MLPAPPLPLLPFAGQTFISLDGGPWGRAFPVVFPFGYRHFWRAAQVITLSGYRRVTFAALSSYDNKADSRRAGIARGQLRWVFICWDRAVDRWGAGGALT